MSIENHPYLNQGKISGAKGLILGSFPVWQCTNPDSREKTEEREKTGSHRFFYGSSRNTFWKLYSKHLSPLNNNYTKQNILDSLNKEKISISDLIVSASRNPAKSSSDNSLKQKVFNIEGIHSLIKNGVCRILCTSKRVLDDLEKILLSSEESSASINKYKSDALNKLIIGAVHEKAELDKRIAIVFDTNYGIVEAISIPSPGSPYRKLKDFGFRKEITEGNKWYLDGYYKTSFKFLKVGKYTNSFIENMLELGSTKATSQIRLKEEIIEMIENIIITRKSASELKEMMKTMQKT